jgi:hypothetical protein
MMTIKEKTVNETYTSAQSFAKFVRSNSSALVWLSQRNGSLMVLVCVATCDILTYLARQCHVNLESLLRTKTMRDKDISDRAVIERAQELLMSKSLLNDVSAGNSPGL